MGNIQEELRRYTKQGSRMQSAKVAKNQVKFLQKELSRDLKQVMDTLKTIPTEALTTRKRKAALRKAGKPLIAAAQAKAPVLRDRSKVTITTGTNQKVVYYPGNLKLSIKSLTFRKSKNAVFVGPKIVKRRKTGDEYGKTSSKVDAYYAAMIEYGTMNMDKTPYMRPAYEATKNQVIQIATKEVEKLVSEWANRNQLSLF